MDDLIFTVHPGILGTRTIASAYADLLLRRLDLIREGQATVNAYLAWGSLRHRPWRVDELKRAKQLFSQGINVPTIAKVIRRSKSAVYKKLAA